MEGKTQGYQQTNRLVYDKDVGMHIKTVEKYIKNLWVNDQLDAKLRYIKHLLL